MIKICTRLLTVAILIISLAGCKSGNTDCPEEYSDVLKCYEKIINESSYDDFESRIEAGNYPSPTGEAEAHWKEMLLDFKSFSSHGYSLYGYMLKDINDDSTPELFLVKEDRTIIAVYTLKGENPTLLDAFDTEYRCVLTDDNRLITQTSESANSYIYHVYTLDSETTELTLRAGFGCEATGDVTVYYENIDGSNYTTDSERYTHLCEEYPFAFGDNWQKNDLYALNK